MTARVAAEYADTSPWTIRRHVRACGRRGRSLVFAIEDVESWMKGEPLVVRVQPGREMAYQPPTDVTISIERLGRLARPDRSVEPAALPEEGRVWQPSVASTQEITETATT
jgi:hypothetical protein